MTSLDKDDPRYEEKMDKLVSTLDKIHKGERLEDNQATIIEKKIKYEEDDGSAIPPSSLSTTLNLTQNNIYGNDTVSTTETSSFIEGEISLPDGGSSGRENDRRGFKASSGD